MKVLVIDDSATMRKIVIKAVKGAVEAKGKSEPQFVEAGDGHEALEQIAKNEDVTLVLCDVNMPNMDGIQFVRSLRAKTTQSRNVGDKCVIGAVANQIPVLMVTTEGGLDKVQEALSAGANDYVKKPFTPEQLGEKIAAFLG
jgi:two-component system chemotaxis response regulator CheY